MALCSVCSRTSLIPDKLDDVILCKVCSLKILLPTWINKTYTDNEAVETQKRRVLAMCKKMLFPDDVILNIATFFDALKKEGLEKELDGHAGQVISVYDDRVLIDTKNSLDYKSVNKSYKNILSGNRGYSSNAISLDSQTTGRILSSVITSAIPGGGIVKTALKTVGQEMVKSTFYQEQASQNNRNFENFDASDKVLHFNECQNIKLIKPYGEEDYGFIMFELKNSNHEAFVFRAGMVKEVSLLFQKMNQFFEEKRKLEPATKQNSNNLELNSLSNYDELIKLKELYDLGIINDEEFTNKKKELLNL